MMSYLNKYDDILNKGARFINNSPDAVRRMWRDVHYNDEPKLYGYGAYFNDACEGISEEAVASGVSFDKNKALAKLLGETVERYLLSSNDNKFLIDNSFRGLLKIGKAALDPSTVISFLDNKYHTENLDLKKINWIKGKSLISGKEVMVPAQMVYVPYLHKKGEQFICHPTSTGAAAGISLKGALYSGICEVVERDAFMIAYLNKLPSPRIDPRFIKDKDIKKIISIFERYRLELAILDITTDVKIPAFAAITLDRTGIGPAVSVGLKAGFNCKEGIIGAIEESLMVRTGTRDSVSYAKRSDRSKIISTIEDRAYYWYSTKKIKNLDFWLNSRRTVMISMESKDNLEDNLENALEIFKKRGIDVLYVDITSPKAKKYGLFVVKVIIPQLHPLYLDENCPYLGGERLYDAPVKMGVIKNPRTSKQLNKIPHPFL